MKQDANQCKHGVSFVEVLSIFASSSQVLELYDEAYDEDEECFVSIGLTL